MSIVAIVCWVVGFLLLVTNDVEDIGGSFNTMWGHRLVALGSLMNACHFFMYSDGEWLGYTVAILNALIFIHHAIQEYYTRSIFTIQFDKYMKESGHR